MEKVSISPEFLIEEALEHRLDLSSLRVSTQSYIFQSFWDFTQDIKGAPRSIGRSRYTLSWEEYPFSNGLKYELQTIFGIYVLSPSSFVFSKGAERPGYAKIYSLMPKIKRALDFIAAVVIQRFPEPASVSSISEIQLADLISVAQSHGCKSCNDIRRGLKIAFHFRSEILVRRKFSIAQKDIDSLVFENDELGGSGTENPIDDVRFFSDAQFAALSQRSLGRIHDFMDRYGLPKADIDNDIFYRAPDEIHNGVQPFATDFDIYSSLRQLDYSMDHRREYEKLKKMLTRSASAIREYVTQVNSAALCVLGLYLGPRYSEMASLMVDCLEERMGVPCVVGRVSKRRGDSQLYDDTWVAIPAVEDAISTLKCLAPLKKNKYLFAPCNRLTGKNQPYLDKSLSGAVNRFLKTINVDGLFDGVEFTTHQFKHSLSRQLVRVKLGLPYISFQMKHLYSRVVSLPSDVTLSYGNAAKLIQTQQSSEIFHELKRDMTLGVFDPAKKIYGGASNEVDERRVSFFKGMTDAGLEKDQLIDGLMKNSISLVNVGLAYCTGVKSDKITGEKPPCLGQLKCNPSACTNSIITKEVHGPAWKAMLNENSRRAKDPRFAYAKEHFEAAVEEARRVCNVLEVKVDDD
ncbi:tyrosine-type recombinase/integrase [Pseudomonas sivasensis]|uniref:tyrosine-type recombinase/integrase n=1 Tax=Pseudomonas sivasensis TaxID=1880678 RepID=UPI000EFF75CA|nr:hypothetical protein ALQ18_02342 [Pseudomonas marginalis pv. marginalis]